MKRWIFMMVCTLLAAGLLCVTALGAEAGELPYTPSTQLEARCVPLMLEQEQWNQGALTGTEWKLLYNPETASMMVELADASTSLGMIGDITLGNWDDVMEEYGYEQLYSTYNNSVYKDKQFRLGWRLLNELEQPIWFPAVNALIGIQEVEYNGKTRYAVGIVFRGSSDVQDWLADFTAYSDEEGYHEGFSQNAEYFYETLSKEVIFHVGNKYYSLYEIYDQMKEPDSDFCMLVMGHSLGAALTNVLVGRYLYEHGVHPSNLAGYAFATPKTAPAGKVEAYPYDNIYNIINADDLVPAITLAGHQRFGQDLVYYPDDQFRLTHYGRDYVENHLEEGNGFWKTVGFLGTLAKPHLIDQCYRDIVASVSASIGASTADTRGAYTTYSTNGYNDWGLLDPVIGPYTFGDLTGELLVNGTLRFRGGVLRVQKDCFLGCSMVMRDEADYLQVGGSLDLSWGVLETDLPHLTAGTVEVKGDFTTGSYSSYNNTYLETGTHRTVFSGTGVQTISLYAENSQFENLYIRNPLVNFGWGVPYMRLAEDAVITGAEDLTVGGTLDLNGYTLQHAGTLYARDFIMGGGSLETAGDTELQNVQKMDGQMVVHGNFETTDTLPFDGGQMWVEGDCYLPATLIMQKEEDFLQVGGLLTLYARDWDEIPDDHLSAGTVELKGDLEFDDCGICTENAYLETGTHRTILSGTGPQTIWFNRAGGPNRFENLCIRNPETSLYMLRDVRLGEDATIIVAGDNREQRVVIDGTLDLADHTLTVDASGWTNTDYWGVDICAVKFGDGGSLQVDGDLRLNGGTVEGCISITGDLTINEIFTFAGGQLSVGGDCNIPKGFIMRNDKDYLLVGGDLTLWSNSDLPADHLTAGTVELKGDLNANGTNAYYCYNATGSHRTIFSGTDTQTVTMGAMYEHKVLQACLRNPKVVLSSVYTLRLMEDGALADASGCLIYGTLDLNGYKLAVQGTFEHLENVTGSSGLVQLAMDAEAGTITVTRPTGAESGETIHILFTGYGSENQMLVCQQMSFASEEEMTETLRLENWPECAEIRVFLLEGDYTPFCSAMSVAGG